MHKILPVIMFVCAAMVASAQTTIPGGSQVESRAAFNCAMFDVMIVTDIGYKNPANVKAIQKRLADIFYMAAPLFENFDTSVKLNLKDILVPVDERPFPELGSTKTFGDMNAFMQEWLNKTTTPMKNYDFVIGISQYDYDPNYWGYSFGFRDGLGSIVMKFLADDVTTMRLLAHELGHSFGASHDMTGGSIMAPNLGGASWSTTTRAEINEFLTQPNTQMFMSTCPTLSFDVKASGNETTLTWQASFEANVSSYVIRYDGVLVDTIEAKGPSNDVVDYEYRYTVKDPLPGERVFSLDQLSKWNRLLEHRNGFVTFMEMEDSNGGAYPNPFIDSLQVAPAAPGERVIIFNALQQVVIDITIETESMTFDTSGWATGLYFVRTASGTRKVIRR
jgi:Metallo-peptidase family M12/Secretion system C-terminal sorting domain